MAKSKDKTQPVVDDRRAEHGEPHVAVETVNPVDTRNPDANYDSRSNIVRP